MTGLVIGNAGTPTDPPICDYIMKLLPGWMQGSVIKGVACSLASVLHTLMDSMKYGREQLFGQLATPQALEFLGRDRRIKRFPSESDEDYRLRVTNAFKLHSKGGTRPGLEDLLALLLPDTQTEIREYGPDSWHLGKNRLGENTYLFDSQALFTFKVIVHAQLEPQKLATLRSAINEIKPAHTRGIIQEAA